MITLPTPDRSGTRCRHLHLLALLFAAGQVAGCASYHPQPLATAIPRPDPALSVLSMAIDRPYLTPQPVDLTAPLTPNALAVIAVLENPDLKALRSKAAVVDAQAFAARLLPDPSVSFGADKILAGPDSVISLAAGLAFDLSMLRSRAAQRAKNTALSAQVRADIAWAEWQTACNARLQGARVVALAAQLPLARQSAAATQLLYDQSAHAATRGDIPWTTLDGRRLAALDASATLRGLERDLAAARLELNRMLGLPPETMLQLARPDVPVPPPSAEALTQLALVQRLDLAALRRGYDAAEADARIAIIQQFPALNLSLNGARDNTNNRSIGGQIGFTLPLWNRNRGGIAVADATRAQLHGEYDARLFQTRAEIAAAVSALAIAARQSAELAAQLPALQRSAEAATRAARRGDIASSVADSSKQSLRDRALAGLQLQQAVAEQSIALELLTGGPRAAWDQGRN
ncbi:MAG: TolC family protein [Pseudomonadota bacterium]|nr:TolC family protein [Pseudomonadota bacterium]